MSLLRYIASIPTPTKRLSVTIHFMLFLTSIPFWVYHLPSPFTSTCKQVVYHLPTTSLTSGVLFTYYTYSYSIVFLEVCRVIHIIIVKYERYDANNVLNINCKTLIFTSGLSFSAFLLGNYLWYLVLTTWHLQRSP